MFERFRRLFQPRSAASGSSDDETPSRFRVLVPIAGGPNALAALRVLPHLGRPEHEVVFLHVTRPGGEPPHALLDHVVATAPPFARVEARVVAAADPFEAILAASHHADLLILGASEEGWAFATPLLDVVELSACPAIVVRRQAGSKRMTRAGGRALVIAESSPRGMLGLERSLRWARLGSDAQEILLIPAPRHLREADPARRRLALRSYASTALRVAPRALRPREVLAEVEATPRDLLVLACDAGDLERGEAWTDEVAAMASCSVVCVFASPEGPRTRRAPSPRASRSGS